MLAMILLLIEALLLRSSALELALTLGLDLALQDLTLGLELERVLL